MTDFWKALLFHHHVNSFAFCLPANTRRSHSSLSHIFRSRDVNLCVKQCELKKTEPRNRLFFVVYVVGGDSHIGRRWRLLFIHLKNGALIFVITVTHSYCDVGFSFFVCDAGFEFSWQLVDLIYFFLFACRKKSLTRVADGAIPKFWQNKNLFCIHLHYRWTDFYFTGFPVLSTL